MRTIARNNKLNKDKVSHYPWPRVFLQQNGLPSRIINYHVTDVITRQRNPTVCCDTVPQKWAKINPPYLRSQSKLLGKRLKECVESLYSQVNAIVFFTNTCCLSSFFPYKDRLNRSQNSKLVYRAS